MSFDLLGEDTERRQASLRPVTQPDAGIFDNFLSGTASYTMQGFAKAGRALSMAVAAPLVRIDDIVGETGEGHVRLSDRYFRFHDDVFGSAVDHWTPKPGETGMAAEVTGALLSTLPLAIANPGAAVASAQLSTGEDLVRKGVEPGKAQAVGAVQGAGLGLGIWLPVLGRTGWERLAIGGASNVTQGALTRGASGAILADTPAADDFKAFDWSAVTLDALLGVAFGGIAHLSPEQRAAGENAWKRISTWVSGAKPSDIDALVTLRQAQHLNADSAPGKLGTPEAIDAHVARMRQAVEQLLRDEPVNVSDLPEPAVEADKARVRDAERQAAALEREAGTVAKDIGIEPRPVGEGEPAKPPAKPVAPAEPPVERIGEALRSAGLEHTEENVANVRTIMRARAADAAAVDALPERMSDGEYMAKLQEIIRAKQSPEATDKGGAPARAGEPGAAGAEARPQGKPAGEAAGREPGEAAAGGEGARQVDPVALEAERFATENPDLQIVTGRDADGKPITTTAAKLLEDSRAVVAQANEQVKLIEAAATCMLGVA
jgi:hypothetical protein